MKFSSATLIFFVASIGTLMPMVSADGAPSSTFQILTPRDSQAMADDSTGKYIIKVVEPMTSDNKIADNTGNGVAPSSGGVSNPAVITGNTTSDAPSAGSSGAASGADLGGESQNVTKTPTANPGSLSSGTEAAVKPTNMIAALYTVALISMAVLLTSF